MTVPPNRLSTVVRHAVAAPGDLINPEIGDGSGYRARQRDLDFLGISSPQLAAWRARTAPLGMSPDAYDALRTGLLDALSADGIASDDCDIRLKGSSAGFFSGFHKEMPRDREALVDLFRELRGRLPEAWEAEAIESKLCSEWISDGDFPARRPFDALHRIGLAREASDYDIQVSSDDVVSRCRDLLIGLGLAATPLRIHHKVYDFVRKDLVQRALPQTYFFSLRIGDALQREVSVAVFPLSGPPDTSAELGELSAHFRQHDWMIQTEEDKR